jgi:2Fe-2S ferredoxin
MITFEVKDTQGMIRNIEVPEEISLSLMEVLKASEYAILATCGGMALCATCHVEVVNGIENLGSPNDSELDMIDTLPNADSKSRLACQIRISEKLNGIQFLLKEAST